MLLFIFSVVGDRVEILSSYAYNTSFSLLRLALIKTVVERENKIKLPGQRNIISLFIYTLSLQFSRLKSARRDFLLEIQPRPKPVLSQ